MIHFNRTRYYNVSLDRPFEEMKHTLHSTFIKINKYNFYVIVVLIPFHLAV